MSVWDDVAEALSEGLFNNDELEFKTVTVTSITPGTYDPATGTNAGGGSATQSLRANVEDYKGSTLLTNTLIQAGDKKVLVLAMDLPFTPKPTDTVTIGSTTYAVVAVPETVEPGESPITYELACRRT